MPHEITGRDNVLICTNHPLSGMGNWHRLGEELRFEDTDNGLTLPDVRRVLGVGDWEVESVPLADLRRTAYLDLDRLGSLGTIISQARAAGYIVLEGDAAIEGHQGIACGHDEAPHYFPTKAYGLLQNETLVELCEVFREAARVERGVDLPILSAGTLRDRRLAFVSVGIPDDPALDGMVARGHAMNLGTSHDGTCSLVGCLASFIVVCGNTFRAALLRNAPEEIRVKHTSSIEDLTEARAILRDMIGAASATDGAIKRLLDIPWRAGDFYNDLRDTILPQVYAKPDDAKGWTGQHTRMEHRLDDVWTAYYGDGVPQDVRGTAWGALMACQGYEQHVKTQRTVGDNAPRHRAAVAIQRTVESRQGTGYPLSEALMHTPLPSLTDVIGTDEAGDTRTLASLMAAAS